VTVGYSRRNQIGISYYEYGNIGDKGVINKVLSSSLPLIITLVPLMSTDIYFR
jgi:hypothetical protein